MTEPKPPVKGELPDVIYAWMGFQDNGSWDRTPCPCTSHESVKYVRADKSVVIPADDFGRMHTALYDAAKYMGRGYLGDPVELFDRLGEVYRLARKYGSAE